MNSWSGIKKQTRAVFGCSLHAEYVDRNALQSIYNVTVLAPAIATVLLEPAIRYTVPVSAIGRPVIKDGYYSIFSEMDGSYLEATIRHAPSIHPHQYQLVRAPDRRSIDSLTIHYDKIEAGFTLLENASYSDIKLYHTRKSVELEAWGRTWKFDFREVFFYPSTNQTDQYIFFEGLPKYEIEVTTDDWVEEGVVLNTIENNLPHIYRPKCDTGCQTAFSLKTPTTNNRC